MAQKQLHQSFTSPLSSGSTRETPDSFDYETKFIVLNFMSRSPHEIPYRNTFSPHTSTSESEYRFHSQGSLSSKSLPSSPPKHYHHHGNKPGGYNNNESKLSKMQRVSEDNIHYKYHKFKSLLEDKLETDGGGSLDSSSDGSQDLSNKKDRKREHDNYNTEEHQKTTGNKKRDSMTLHQFRQLSMNRAPSSLSADYSADDEYEDTSCGSSLIGSLSNSASNLRKDGRHEVPVDFQQVISRLPTVKSESEMEDELLGALNNPSNSSQNVSELGLEDINIEMKSDAIDDTFENDPALSTSLSVATTSVENVSGSKSLDRSKLKLNIQEQVSSENTEKIEKWEAIAASLRAELEDEMTSLESEVEEAIKKNVISPITSPFLTPLSPQSEAARFLARIGDELQDEYRDRLDLSIRRLVLQQQFSYEDFKCIAKDMIDKNLPGWRQVVLLMLYGQRAAWKVVESGQKKISDMVDYTTRLVADMTADFIISQGGWGAVMNSDPSLSSESPATNASESPLEAPPLTKHHWVASPVGDGGSTPSPGSEIAPLASSLSASSEIQAQAADGDHLVRVSSPLIHMMTTSPVPKEAWTKKENVGSAESHLEAQSNNNNVTDGSTLVDDFAELESSQAEGNEENNNSSAPNEINETIRNEVPVAYFEDGYMSSSSGEDIDQGPQRAWYNWLFVPEHFLLISCLLASIGIGALMSARNKN